MNKAQAKRLALANGVISAEQGGLYKNRKRIFETEIAYGDWEDIMSVLDEDEIYLLWSKGLKLGQRKKR